MLRGLLLATLCAPVLGLAPVFTDKEVKDCTRIRTPELVRSSKQNLHIFATCCGKNACGHKTREPSQGNATLGDNHDDARVIMKSSSDMGKTWTKTQFLAGGKKGYAGVNAIFDAVVGTLVVQYHHGEDPSSMKYYQHKTKDHGSTWMKEQDITKQISGCMNGQTAGQRVQTASGRLLWYGKSCVWYSDDHGANYKWKKVNNVDNEVSFVSLPNGHLFANGRGTVSDWKPHRVDYVSDNDGTHWVKSKSELKDPKEGSVERSLVYDHTRGVMYSAGPEGTKDGGRYKLVVSCSTNNGRTWPHSYNVNGNHAAAYSSLLPINKGKQLVVVWDHEANDIHTVGESPLFQIIGVGWCTSKGNSTA